MQNFPPAHYTAWWRCCQCAREVNPKLFGEFCPDCSHRKCYYCETVAGGPRPRPSHGLKTVLFSMSFDIHCFCDPEYDCDCDCDPCSCSPPPPPRPRPTRSIGCEPYWARSKQISAIGTRCEVPLRVLAGSNLIQEKWLLRAWCGQ
jgi:hypothetical protein